MLTEKLYSPLEFYFHDPVEKESSGDPGDLNSEYGLYDIRYKISDIEAYEFMDDIELAVMRDRNTMDKVHGMAEYLPDELKSKVHSMFPSIELHGNNLYCVTAIELNEALTAEEIAVLKDDWSGQLSDGWGEGFEQREIQIGRDELYIVPWSSDDGFFIDTEQEFLMRLGIEMPTVEQTAIINEPMERLEERLNANFADYMETTKSLSGTEIAQISSRIAIMAEAHNYLTGAHNFQPFELEYLLQFKNPLEIVADEFESYGLPDDSRHTEMWRIFDRQEHDGYELIDDEPAHGVATSTADTPNSPDITALRELLVERASQNWEDYRYATHNFTPDTLFHKAVEVIGRRDACEYLKNFEGFTAEQLNCLLQFSNPVGLVADYSSPADDISVMPGVLADIVENQDKFKQHYSLVAHQTTTTNKALGSSERPSVLDEIRQAQKAQRERSLAPNETPPHDKSTRKKSEHDL